MIWSLACIAIVIAVLAWLQAYAANRRIDHLQRELDEREQRIAQAERELGIE